MFKSSKVQQISPVHSATNSQKYSARFLDIYGLAKSFTQNYRANLTEVFEFTLEYYDSSYSLNYIQTQLESRFKTNSPTRKQKFIQEDFPVWLTFAETGQGKSTFTNAICESQVAVEGEGINSHTQTINLYKSKHNVIVVDTPGLYDTGELKNEDISDQIVEMVQDKLKENANIKAIFFIWNPTATMRLRLDHILENLEATLGKNVISSVIFVVNKVTDSWRESHDKAVKEFQKKIREKGLRNPLLVFDFKEIDKSLIEKLKEETQNVEPYREKEFEEHRKNIFYEKYLNKKQVEEEKKRKEQEIEQRVKAQYDKKVSNLEDKIQEQKQENLKTINQLKEEHERHNRQLEMQIQQNNYENEQKLKREENNRKYEIETLKRESELRETRAENNRRKEIEEVKVEYEQKLSKERQQRIADNERIEREYQQKAARHEEERRQEAERNKQRIENLEREMERKELQRKISQANEQSVVSYSSPYQYSPFPQYHNYPSASMQNFDFSDFSGFGSSPQKFSNLFSNKVNFSCSDSQSKVPTSKCNSTSTKTSNSRQQKFYKGGQFIPGGGRAPKGGIYM